MQKPQGNVFDMTLISIAIIQNKQANKKLSVSEDAEKLESLCIAVRNVK